MTINVTPAPSRQVMGSRNQSAARMIVNGRLSLSIGATHETGAISSARKYASQEIPVASPESPKNRSVRREMSGIARC